MEEQFNSPRRTYITSNTATVVHFLWFMMALLLVFVVGICGFVIFGRDDAQRYHWDEQGKFFYTLSNDQAEIVELVDVDAESYTVPSVVNYGGKNYPVRIIGARAFAFHSNLKSVVIPDSVTEIAGSGDTQSGAFAGCLALTNVDLGKNVARIGKYAFKNCLSLITLDLPESVQFVEDCAFQGCLALTSVKLNSNAYLGAGCFENCLHVTTLILADEVQLSENARRVLSDLTQLTSFVVSENHPVYCVQNAGNGECLLTKNVMANDTVVLGGCGAEVPVGVTQIDDWAWGERAQDDLYVPSSVLSVGANSFNCAAICTDADSKPNEWLTTIPVYTQARLITFVAEGNVTTQAYVYRDANDEIYPAYDDLFPGVGATPFVEWGEISGVNCPAVYRSKQVVTSLDELNNLISTAETYLNNDEIRLKFTLEFWENFKSLCAVAKTNHDYQYEVDDLVQALQSAIDKIDTANDLEILSSTDWWVGLQDLITVVDQVMELMDFSDSVTDEQVEQIITKTEEAEFAVQHYEQFTVETGKFIWHELRGLCENLEFNIGTDSALGQEIAKCESLHREDYTKASWQKLQTQLKLAKQITEYNLTRDLLIAQIYMDLADAHGGLREITLPENLTCLRTWIAICRDLPSDKYQHNSYDRLLLEVQIVVNRADQLVNNAKVNQNLANLQNLYHNLVPTNQEIKYQNNAGVFSRQTIPYFILVVMLFTGAVVFGAKAAQLQKQLRKD